MDSFGIGISGLNAAQRAFDIAGNNIANAATEGYHRQRLNLSPSYTSQIGSVVLGGGVDIAGITRMIDGFLQKEIFRQQSSLDQVSQELAMLRTVENSFGELSDGSGLSTTLDDFFNALQDLSAHPAESIWQNQAVTSAQTMAAKFKTLGQFLTSLESQINSRTQPQHRKAGNKRWSGIQSEGSKRSVHNRAIQTNRRGDRGQRVWCRGYQH